MCLKVQWPGNENVLQLPLAAGISRDNVGQQTQKPNGTRTLLAPAVGLEPSLEHPDSYDSVAITRKGADGETLLKRGESVLPDLRGTRVPGSHSSSIDVLLSRTRLVWGTLRVI